MLFRSPPGTGTNTGTARYHHNSTWLRIRRAAATSAVFQKLLWSCSNLRGVVGSRGCRDIHGDSAGLRRLYVWNVDCFPQIKPICLKCRLFVYSISGSSKMFCYFRCTASGHWQRSPSHPVNWRYKLVSWLFTNIISLVIFLPSSCILVLLHEQL